MNDLTWLWIALAILVVLVLVALLARSSRRSRENQARAEAATMRAEASKLDNEVQQRHAHAAQAETKAEQARVQAAEARGEADRVRAERDDQMRRADALDPDVETDEEGRRLDGRTYGVDGELRDGTRAEERTLHGDREGLVDDRSRGYDETDHMPDGRAGTAAAGGVGLAASGGEALAGHGRTDGRRGDLGGDGLPDDRDRSYDARGDVVGDRGLDDGYEQGGDNRSLRDRLDDEPVGNRDAAFDENGRQYGEQDRGFAQSEREFDQQNRGYGEQDRGFAQGEREFDDRRELRDPGDGATR